MDLLGVDGKGEKDALAILTKFSADHCQVSFLKQVLEIKSYTIRFNIPGYKIRSELSSEKECLVKPPCSPWQVLVAAGSLVCIHG